MCMPVPLCAVACWCEQRFSVAQSTPVGLSVCRHGPVRVRMHASNLAIMRVRVRACAWLRVCACLC